MTAYLTFQLHGALQAYGLVALGEVRLSSSHPTRSAVFGLLGACLGLRRGEEERLRALSDGYGLAVRVDEPGAPLLDFHTTQSPPEVKKRVYRTRADELGGLLGPDEEPHTILSQRGYLCDAYFTACLWAVASNPPHALETLAEALRRPVFTPYLGRKCCPPSLPFNPAVGEYATHDAALSDYRLDGRAFWPGRAPSEASPLYVDEPTTAAGRGESYLVRDRVTHHARRQFAERRVVRGETPAAAVNETSTRAPA